MKSSVVLDTTFVLSSAFLMALPEFCSSEGKWFSKGRMLEVSELRVPQRYTCSCRFTHEALFLLQVMDDYSVIGRSLFKKETNIQIFVGLKVKLSTGEDGIIDGGFGQSGKFKIRIPGRCLSADKY